MIEVTLPWPPSILAGHAKGNGQWKKIAATKALREAAKDAVEAIGPITLADGDILISITFYPPDLRGDRCNFYNRLKGAFDGVADALSVNDRRFVPTTMHYAEPVKDPRVVFVIGGRG